MIKFTKVKMQNFKSFKQAEIQLDNQGLVLIEGKNNTNDQYETNGAGKTTALESITYALYNTTGESIRADDVINRDEGKNLAVKLYLEKDGQKYRIERYRNHHKHKNKVLLFKGNEELTSSTNKKTDELIQELIGVQPDTYFNSIMYGQGDNEIFAQATDKGKKEILENITDIAVYAKAQEVAKDKYKEVEQQFNELDNEKQSIQNQKDQIHAQVQEAENNYKHIKDQIDQLKRNKKETADTLKGMKYDQKKQDFEKTINDLKTEYSLKQDRTFDPINQDRSELDKYTEQINKVDNKITEINFKTDQLNQEINNLANERSTLDTQDTCQYCGAPLDTEHAKKREQEINEEINQKNQVIEKMSQAIQDQLNPMLEKLNQAKQAEQQKLDDQSKEQRQQEQEHYQQLQELSNQINTQERQLDQLETQKANLEQSIENTQGQIDNLNSIPKPDKREKELKDLDKELEIVYNKETELQEKLNNYADVKTAFSNKGIRSVVLDLVTPMLNKSANQYLAELSDSFLQVRFKTQVEKQDGTLTDKFDVEVINGDDHVTYQTLSQGERTRVNVAISLALQDLVFQNSNLQANIGLYDEVFDGLDEKGVESVINILNKRAKDIGTVYVITHSTTMKPLFEKVLTVEKTDGESKIVMEEVE